MSNEPMLVAVIVSSKSDPHSAADTFLVTTVLFSVKVALKKMQYDPVTWTLVLEKPKSFQDELEESLILKLMDVGLVLFWAYVLIQLSTSWVYCALISYEGRR